MSVERDPPPDPRTLWLSRPAVAPVRAPSEPPPAERGAFAAALQRAERRRDDAPAPRAPAAAPGRGGAALESGARDAAAGLAARRGGPGHESGRGPGDARAGTGRPAVDRPPAPAPRESGGPPSRASSRDAVRDGERRGETRRAEARDEAGDGSLERDDERLTSRLGAGFGPEGFAGSAFAALGGHSSTSPADARPVARVAAEPGGASRGTLAGPLDARALAALLTRLQNDAGAGGGWHFTVLGGAGDVEAVRLQRAADGAWRVRVTLREREDGVAADELEASLGAALGARGHRVDALVVTSGERRGD